MTPGKIRKFLTPLLLIGAIGCQPILSTLSRNSTEPPPKARDVSLDQLQPDDFPGEIKRLETTINSSLPYSPEKQEAQYRLALLYLLPDNPLHDESKAVATLLSYLESSEGSARQREARLWLQILDEKNKKERSATAEAERREQEIAVCEMNKQQLVNQVKELTESNAKLKQNIDKLKMIDLSVEKKRKSFR